MRDLSTAFTTLALCACTTWPQPVVRVANVLDGYRVSALSSETRAEVIGRAQHEVAKDPSLTNRLRLALLQSDSEATLEERIEARELLSDCESGDASEVALTQLCEINAALLARDLQAHARIVQLGGQIRESQQREDDLRKQLGSSYAQSAAKMESQSQHRINELQRQLSQQQQQLNGVREQLDELQAIERSVSGRDRPIAPKAVPRQ